MRCRLALIAVQGLDPAGSMNIGHHSFGNHLVKRPTTIRARKPATALAARLHVVDMPRAVPPSYLIRCSGKMAIVQAKEVLTHLA